MVTPSVRFLGRRLEHGDLRAGPVVTVAHDHLSEAVSVDVANAYPMGVDVAAGHEVAPGPHTAAPLDEDGDVGGGVQLARHGHDVVVAVAVDVGDLEVVVAAQGHVVVRRPTERAGRRLGVDAHGVAVPADHHDVGAAVGRDVGDARLRPPQ